MSEEKLYAIKNDEGKWSDDGGLFYPAKKNGVGFIFTMFSDRDEATRWAEINTKGGHVVALIEEPEKVVLTKEQAEIVKRAHVKSFPATFIYDSNEKDEELLMKAYVNGYTVKEEKQYNVKVPHTEDVWYYKTCDGNLMTISDKKLRSDFTEEEIEHYGLQDCEKEEVTDDEQ